MSSSRRSRVSWGVAAQACSSLGNFVLGLVVLRSVDLDQLGAYAIASAVGLFTLGAVRAFGGKTFGATATAAPGAHRRDAGALTGLALAVGVAVGMAVAVGAVIVGAPVAGPLLVVAVGLPGLLVHDAWRFAFVADGTPRRAAAIDTTWTVLQLTGFGVVVATGRASAVAFLAVWVLTGTLTAVGTCLWQRRTPNPRAAAAFVRGNRALAGPMLGEHLLSQGANQLGLVTLSAIVPLASLGALRAGQVLLSPTNVLQQAVPLVAMPEASRSRGRSLHAVRRTVVATASMLLAGTTLLVVVLAVVPDAVGTAVFGTSWEAGRALLAPLAVRNLAAAVALSASIGLQAIGAAGATLRIGAARGVVSLVGAVVLGATVGIDGAAWGMAGADLLAAVLAASALARRTGWSIAVHEPGPPALADAADGAR